MSADPITLLLGADSLAGTRSGVGRMTLEIACQLPTQSDIAAYGFLSDNRVQPPEWVRHFVNPLGSDKSASQAQSFTHRFIKQPLSRIAAVRALRGHIRRAQLNAAVTALSNNHSPVLYHEPNMITSPYDGPTVATFNDLSWHWDAALHPSDRLRWIESNLPRVIREATRFVAISAFTANEVVRELGIPRDRIDVVPLAASSAFHPIDDDAAAPVLKSFGLKDQSYVFSVSTLEPRKNFDRLLAAYLKLPSAVRSKTPLVIAGGKGWGNVLKSAERALAAGELRLLGHIPDAALVALTARCAVFAYVSLYEGFGLPILEAMAAGAPVIASATTAAGETGGSGALLVDPSDEEAIALQLRVMLDEPELRRSWRAAGLARSAGFSWPHTVDRLIATWHRALGHRQPAFDATRLLVNS